MEWQTPHALSLLAAAFVLYLAYVRFLVGLKWYGRAMVGLSVMKFTFMVMGYFFFSQLLGVLLFILYMKSYLVIRNDTLYDGRIY